MTYSLKRKLLSQNFLHSRKLVKQLVGSSSISKKDLVIEIGPGSGIITKVLVNKAEQVIAVEIDQEFCSDIKEKLSDCSNLVIYQQDFLSWPLPNLPFKIFANIPFAIEGKIVRKILRHENPVEDCYLVVMDKFAQRLTQSGNNLLSALHSPWFELSITHCFRQSDFTPRPSVKAVLLRIRKKKNFLLDLKQRNKYQQFVRRGYKNGISVRKNLSKVFSTMLVDESLHRLSLRKTIKPSQMSVQDWAMLFENLVG